MHWCTADPSHRQFHDRPPTLLPFLSYLAAPRKRRVSFLHARTVGRALGRGFFSTTRSLAFYRRNHDPPFALRRSFRTGRSRNSRVARASAPSHGAVAGRKPTRMCVAPFIPTSATWPTVQGRGVGVRWAQQFVTGCRSTFRQPRGEKPSPRPNGVGGRKCRAQTQLRRSPCTIR